MRRILFGLFVMSTTLVSAKPLCCDQGGRSCTPKCAPCPVYRCPEPVPQRTSEPVKCVKPCDPMCMRQNYWQTFLELHGRTNGYRKGAGTYLFVPVLQNSRAIFFSQLMGGHFLNAWTGNVGFGYRRFVTPSFAWGVNAFVDVSYSDRDVAHSQGSVGGELFGTCWEARINGYFPRLRRTVVGEEQASELTTRGSGVFQNTFTRRYIESAYRGFDAEAGYGFDICHGSLWGWVGYYAFKGERVRSFYGPRVRLEYRLDNVLWCGVQAIVGGEFEHDKIHGGKTSLLLSFRVPLGCPAKSDCCSPSSIYRRMGNRVRRIESIVITETTERRNEVLTAVPGPFGNPLNIFFANQNGRGEGSQEAPTSLDRALAIAGPHDTIVLVNDGGPINVSDTISLPDYVSLVGFGNSTNLNVNLPVGTLSFSSEMGRAALASQGGDVIRLGNHNRVAGISIEGGDRAIVGNDPHGTTISDIAISGTAGDAIHLPGAHHTVIDGAELSDIGGNGIFLNTKETELRNLNIERVGRHGVMLANAVGASIQNARMDSSFYVVNGHDIAIENLQATSMRLDRIEDLSANDVSVKTLSIVNSVGDATFRGLTVTSDGDGVLLKNNAGAVSLFDSTITAEGRGIVADHQNGLLTMRGGAVRSSQAAALDLTSTNVDMDIGALTSWKSPAEGIRLEQVAGRIAIKSGQITEPAGAALRVLGGAPLFEYTGSITNVKDHVISIDGVKGGSIAVNGITDKGGRGILVQNSGCAVTLTNVEIVDPKGSAAIFLVNNTGPFELHRSHISGTSSGVWADHVSHLSVKNSHFENVNVAIDLLDPEGATLIENNRFEHLNGLGRACRYRGSKDGMLYVNGNEMIGGQLEGNVSLFNGLEAYTLGDATLDLTFNNNTVFGLINSALFVSKSGEKGKTIVAAIGNDILAANGGDVIHLETDPSVSNTHFEFTIEHNSIANAQASGIVIDANSGAGSEGSTFVGRIRGNTLTDLGTTSSRPAIVVANDLQSAADTLTVAIEDNNTVTRAASVAIAAESLSGSKGTFNLTINENHDREHKAGHPAYQVTNQGLGILSLTMKGNTSDREAPAIFLMSTTGAATRVTHLSDLDTNNANIGVDTYGSIEETDTPSLRPTPPWE